MNVLAVEASSIVNPIESSYTTKGKEQLKFPLPLFVNDGVFGKQCCKFLQILKNFCRDIEKTQKASLCKVSYGHKSAISKYLIIFSRSSICLIGNLH